MDFGKRLAALRKERAMTQQALADQVGCHVTMIRRYEANETQPTLEVIRKLVRALSVSADALVFEEGERGPDEEFRLQFEALSTMPEQEKALARSMLEAIILKSRVAGAVHALSATTSTKAAPEKPPAASAKRKASATTHR
jgi:transcriptional regulator with XRE-family HTH domain